MERFWSKVYKTDNCWFWLGSRSSRSGYGNFRFQGKNHPAHHVAWFLTYGRWPLVGLELMHRCDTKQCVRPEHLCEGTRKENMVDAAVKGLKSMRLHTLARGCCRRGHPLRPETTYISPGGQTQCRLCKKENDESWRKKNRKRHNARSMRYYNKTKESHREHRNALQRAWYCRMHPLTSAPAGNTAEKLLL